MALNGKNISDAMQGLMAANSATGITNVNARFGKAHYKSTCLALGTSAADAETPVDVVDVDLNSGVNVTSAAYLPSSTLTASSTNYVTLTLEQATPAGVVTAIGSIKTQPSGSGNWTAQVAVPLTLTSTSCFIPAGNSIILKTAMTASGVAVPAGAFVVNGVFV